MLLDQYDNGYLKGAASSNPRDRFLSLSLSHSKNKSLKISVWFRATLPISCRFSLNSKSHCINQCYMKENVRRRRIDHSERSFLNVRQMQINGRTEAKRMRSTFETYIRAERSGVTKSVDPGLGMHKSKFREIRDTSEKWNVQHRIGETLQCLSLSPLFVYDSLMPKVCQFDM